jgi:hypothetical protein
LVGQKWLAAERLIFGGATEEPPETASPKILALAEETKTIQGESPLMSCTIPLLCGHLEFFGGVDEVQVPSGCCILGSNPTRTFPEHGSISVAEKNQGRNSSV